MMLDLFVLLFYVQVEFDRATWLQTCREHNFRAFNADRPTKWNRRFMARPLPVLASVSVGPRNSVTVFFYKFFRFGSWRHLWFKRIGSQLHSSIFEGHFSILPFFEWWTKRQYLLCVLNCKNIRKFKNTCKIYAIFCQYCHYCVIAFDTNFTNIMFVMFSVNCDRMVWRQNGLFLWHQCINTFTLETSCWLIQIHVVRMRWLAKGTTKS